MLLSSTTANRPHPVIENVQLDSTDLISEDIRFATIRDCGFKDALVDRLSFRFVTFVNCYFRSARFDCVRFEGCRFVDCNFHRATFTRCTFDYSEFEGTQVTFAQIKDCMPAFHNVRRLLAMSLKANAGQLGDTEDARRFLLVELDASRAFNFGKAFYWNDSFYKKYGARERLVAFWDLLTLLFSDLVWGHGEKIARLVVTGLVVVGVFGLVFSHTGIEPLTGKGSPSPVDYVDFSLNAFTNTALSRWLPANATSYWLARIEGIAGLILFGFLVAAIFRRISRR